MFLIWKKLDFSSRSWWQIMFVCVCLLAAPIPLSQSQASIDSLQGWTAYTTCFSSGLWPHSASCCQPEETHLTYYPSSSSLSSFFLLLQSLLLPITPSFPWPETEDVWWQRCQHRSRWSSPTVLFPLAQESIHSSPFSASINLLSVLSGSTFLPIKSFHCPALQGSGYTGL